ncbi:MAG: aldose epimerase family protein [Caulobacteraceae bacterium]
MEAVRYVFDVDGKEVYLITLKNKNGIEVKLLNYGAAVVELLVPDREGNAENVVLTYENIEDYIKNPPYIGAVLGRTAGRIADGEFTLDGQKYQLNRNFVVSQCHGGDKGFSFKVWNYRLLEGKAKTGVEFTYLSKDMEEGYPGNLEAKVTYTLTENNELSIEYEAISDKNTLCNLTNHTYFNLSGSYKRKVTEQYLRVKAENFLESDKNLIPTGKLIKVDNTPMDFRESKLIGRDIESDYEAVRAANGYDCVLMLKDEKSQIELYDELSGRKMTVGTTYPCAVIYTYNFANGEKLKYGKTGSKYDGICFETQYEPDGINHDNFNSAILTAGSKYCHKTVFSFTTTREV